VKAYRMLVVVATAGALLSGCATWNKSLDIVQGGLTAASATIDIFRAAGQDTQALWTNVWTPLGLSGTPVTEPFAAPKAD
jgi:uncharacterized protein YceK